VDTPVAFLIFNRPELTARVFAEIAAARPRKLLVVADGPRSADERELCERTRAVIDRVDWDCEVLTNYSDVNLGCKRRVSSGLDWVFEQCEEAIILEDDCLPDLTFFRFCAELLEKYRHDERIVIISGNNFQFGRNPTPYSYYYSLYGHTWGWASWRRAWRYYDLDMKLWPTSRQTSWLHDFLGDNSAVDYWAKIFDSTYAGKIDTWDYQWLFARWIQNGLAITPGVNLVTNLGFNEDATHTKDAKSILAKLPIGQMTFPIQHPPSVFQDEEADRYTFEQHYGAPRGLRQPDVRSRLRQFVAGITHLGHSSSLR
jgi:hypothetical protein